MEILGWAIFYYMMTLVSEDHITIAGICQSVVILLIFFGEGISKATIAICGNLIGAKRPWFIPNVLKAGVWIHFFSLHYFISLCTI